MVWDFVSQAHDYAYSKAQVVSEMLSICSFASRSGHVDWATIIDATALGCRAAHYSILTASSAFHMLTKLVTACSRDMSGAIIVR